MMLRVLAERNRCKRRRVAEIRKPKEEASGERGRGRHQVFTYVGISIRYVQSQLLAKKALFSLPPKTLLDVIHSRVNAR